MRITKIDIQNFRAFFGEYSFNLGKKGKNLLVYGENGSGKSSLYWALYEFLRAQGKPIEPHRNIFANSSPARITLELRENETSSAKVIEWSTTTNETHDQLIVEAAQSSGFLEYKTLLETYFIPLEDERINMFSLVRRLFTHIPDHRNTTIATLWHRISQAIPKRNTPHTKSIVDDHVRAFNVHFGGLLRDIQMQANNILAHFGYPLTWKFRFDGLAYEQWTKTISGQHVYLDVEYCEQTIDKHHGFLNEAKLSALALSLYFAAQLQTPKGDLNILILDDVLIGLDMANRMPIISILETFFSDYQIFFFTYDRMWFEMMRLRTPDATWQYFEIFCGKHPDNNFELPIHKTAKDNIAAAEYHLTHNEYKASVIFLRTAFELILKKFASDKRIKVPYHDDFSKSNTDTFWVPIKEATNKQTKLPFVDSILASNIDVHRKSLLNPIAHSSTINPTRKEIEDALNDIKQLIAVLESWLKDKNS